MIRKACYKYLSHSVSSISQVARLHHEMYVWKRFASNVICLRQAANASESMDNSGEIELEI